MVQDFPIGVGPTLPGNYVSIVLGAGVQGGSQGVKSAVILANRLSAGWAMDGYVYGPDSAQPVANESDVISAFGAGSEQHVCARSFWLVNRSTPLYFAVVAESSGSQASLTLTFTNTATANATVRTYIGKDFVDTGVVSGATPAQIAIAVSAMINSKTYLPVTASPSTNTVVITAKQKGLRGNQIVGSALISPATGVATTVSPNVMTNFTGGTSADDNTAILAKIAPRNFYYIISADNSTTQMGALNLQVLNNADPNTGLRSVAGCGFTGSLSNAQTLTASLNSVRSEVVFQMLGDLLPCELASRAFGAYSLFEQDLGSQSSLNFDFFGSTNGTAGFWGVPAPISGVQMSKPQLSTCLTSGITPVHSNGNGVSFILERVTSKYTSSGVLDLLAKDSHKRTVCDFYADLVLAKSANLQGKTISANPAKGQPRKPNSVCPEDFRQLLISAINEFDGKGLVQNASVIKADILCDLSSNPNRINALVPMQVVSLLHQTTVLVNEISP